MSKGSVVPVLMYHHVTPAGGMINATPQNFESQLKWLKQHGYQTLGSKQLAAHLQGQAAAPRSVVLTFDDGYLDNYVYAYPLLKKYGFKALIFLVTSWMQEGPARHCQGEGVLPETPDHAQSMSLAKQADYDAFALRWSEVRKMAEHGVCEFHSHTHTHTRWDKTDPAHKNQHMARELEQSRQVLAQQLGGVSDHLCWPQGYYDADYQRLANQAGFRYLYTTQAFGQNLPGTDPSAIYRFAVRNTHGGSVGRRIRVAAHPVVGPLFNRWKLWKRSRRSK